MPLATILTGAKIAGSAVGAASGLQGMLTGARGRKKRLKEQTDAQTELNENSARIGYEWNEKAADNAAERQKRSTKELYEELYSPKALIQQGRDAGVNPVTMLGGGQGYSPTAVTGSAAMGGAGGTSAGNAPSMTDVMGMQQAGGENASRAMMNAAMGIAQIKNIDADTNKKAAETENLGAETEGTREQTATTKDMRKWLVGKARQEGESVLLDNIIKKFFMTTNKDENTMDMWRDDTYGNFHISSESYMSKKEAGEITKLWADVSLTEAKTELTNEEKNVATALADLTNRKAQGYLQELMNGTIQAMAAAKNAATAEKMYDNDVIKTAAQELAIHLGTGEKVNWKTIVDYVFKWMSVMAGGAQSAGKAAAMSGGGMN